MSDDKKFDALAEVLDVEPDYVRVPSVIRDKLEEITDPSDREYEIARMNLIELMKEGGDAISDLKSLALQTQSARYYEALTEMLKTMITAQREMMEIKKLNASMKEDDSPPGKGATNNILVCSTTDLIDMINSKKG
jgi:hypothetical protein